MADAEPVAQIKISKNSKILVNVEEVLQDILVVSYSFDSKLYEGVLLDSTRKNLPSGMAPSALASLFSTQQSSPKDGDEDRLFSVSQRFSYFPDKAAPPASSAPASAPFHLRRAIRPPARYKNARMTVRLRPRQVLCSKCRSICNENSENVDLSRKRRSADPLPDKSDKKLNPSDISSRSPRPLFSENQRDNQPKMGSPPSDSSKMCPTLIPKISRLQPNEISSALSGSKMKIVGSYWVNNRHLDPQGEGKKVMEYRKLGEDRKVCGDHNFDTKPLVLVPPDVDDPDDEPSTIGEEEEQEGGGGMVLRKKRSVGSMEDLWDESVFEAEEGAKRARGARTTPVIKISFGSQGEGTVLKIPARLRDCTSDTEQSLLPPPLPQFQLQPHSHSHSVQHATRDASAKAAKKALKKAKREARRKLLVAGAGASPGRPLGAGSPAYGAPSPYDAAAALYHRRHKHKVKHKKKHREQRRHGKEDSGGPDSCARRDSYSAIKERCLKQKLSISLKRLNANAYYLGSTGSKSPTASSCSNSELSDDPGEAVPDFPAPMLLRHAHSVASCVTSDGRHMAVGDVVWGKIHGFPWWPGKVLSMTVSHKEDGSTLAPQAHVAWYGSSTSSLMPCDQLSPFLETFKMRYNKKKRGPYKEAIRQATNEAREATPSLQDASLSLSTSPPEVNVIS